MAKPALTWELIVELAEELGESARLWKSREHIPDGARWRLYNAARKRRVTLTNDDFDALIPVKRHFKGKSVLPNITEIQVNAR